VPSHNSYPQAGKPSSATVTYQKAARRIRKAKRAAPPSPGALGLYRTDTALAKHARWPVGAVRRWIAGGYIRPLLHRGKLFYSIRSVQKFVARVLRDWPKNRGFLERSVGTRLEYDPRTMILRKVGPLPS
jgi:hypothetical protein